MLRDKPREVVTVHKLKASLSETTRQRTRLLAAFYGVLQQDMLGMILTRVIDEMWDAHMEAVQRGDREGFGQISIQLGFPGEAEGGEPQ